MFPLSNNGNNATQSSKTKMMTKRMQDLGFECLGINSRGTETYTVDGMTVKSYESGYVRREDLRTSYNRAGLHRAIWQINKVDRFGNRIMLMDPMDRYERLCDWLINSRNRSGALRPTPQTNKAISEWKLSVMPNGNVLFEAL